MGKFRQNLFVPSRFAIRGSLSYIDIAYGGKTLIISEILESLHSRGYFEGYGIRNKVSTPGVAGFSIHVGLPNKQSVTIIINRTASRCLSKVFSGTS